MMLRKCWIADTYLSIQEDGRMYRMKLIEMMWFIEGYTPLICTVLNL